jgi:2-polyprenyl-6-methoxyphenol hydroxylase-like FAD-dependent oxidoreductase
MGAGGVRVVVVGAGIAGLATAIALHRRDVEVEVLERAHALTEVGAALSLWPNALAALAELGLEDDALAAGSPEVSGTLRSPSGAVIMRANEGQLRRALGGPTIAIHRADLQRLMLEAAAGIPIRLGSGCVSVEVQHDRVIAHRADGTHSDADALVGCDGIHSAVRASVFGGDPPRYVGYTTWRAVVAAGWLTEGWLTIGAGKQFIASPITHGRAYWAAGVTLTEGANRRLPAGLPFLAKAFQGWHAPIGHLLALSSEDDLIRTDVYDRPTPVRMSLGSVALAGDAAHPMTPDLGQGGCQALEDGVILAACLERFGEPAAAFAAYQSARLARVGRIVRDSRAMGELVSLKNPLLRRARDVGLRLTPTRYRLHRLAGYGSRTAFHECLRATQR